MYAVQDMCWEDFALANGLVVKRSPEVQQSRGRQKGCPLNTKRRIPFFSKKEPKSSGSVVDLIIGGCGTREVTRWKELVLFGFGAFAINATLRNLQLLEFWR